MLTLFPAMSLGFVLGLRHAFDADHLVAVSTIVSEQKSVLSSVMVGIFWGLGHTFTLFAVGMAVLFFKIGIPERIEALLEMLVGLMLIFLGVSAFLKYRREGLVFSEHSHQGEEHHHFVRKEEYHQHRLGSFRLRSFLIGSVHGLAGSAALSLLVLASMSSVSEGILYILVFGLGSIIGMLLAGAVISVPVVASAKRFSMRKTVSLAGLLSVALGLLIVWESGSFLIR